MPSVNHSMPIAVDCSSIVSQPCVVACITSQLGLTFVRAACAVSRSWNAAVHDNALLWRQLIEQVVGGQAVARLIWPAWYAGAAVSSEVRPSRCAAHAARDAVRRMHAALDQLEVVAISQRWPPPARNSGGGIGACEAARLAETVRHCRTVMAARGINALPIDFAAYLIRNFGTSCQYTSRAGRMHALVCFGVHALVDNSALAARSLSVLLGRHTVAGLAACQIVAQCDGGSVQGFAVAPGVQQSSSGRQTVCCDYASLTEALEDQLVALQQAQSCTPAMLRA